MGIQNTKQEYIVMYTEIHKHLSAISKAANATKPIKAFMDYVKAMYVVSY